MIVTIIGTMFLGLILGWREVQNVIHKVYFDMNPGGSISQYWKYTTFKKWFWWIPYGSKWKDFDSFHFLVGLAVLIISFLIQMDYELLFAESIVLRYLSQTITLWVWIFYWRNISMHIILPKKGYKRWGYLIPLMGKWIKST